VEAIGAEGLVALASAVPADEYGDEQLRGHLEDLAWVERTARRHEEVLDAVLRETTIVPLRLCTLYRDRDGVRRLLSEHRAALNDALQRVDGCLEWGVKVFSDPRAQHHVSDMAGEMAGEGESGGGTMYLRQRQRQRALAEQASELRVSGVQAVDRRMAALARSSRSNPVQRREAHGRLLHMVFNGVYLVERHRAAEVREAIHALQEEWGRLGLSVELTGPWPPYNFVSGAAGVLA